MQTARRLNSDKMKRSNTYLERENILHARYIEDLHRDSCGKDFASRNKQDRRERGGADEGPVLTQALCGIGRESEDGLTWDARCMASMAPSRGSDM